MLSNRNGEGPSFSLFALRLRSLDFGRDGDCVLECASPIMERNDWRGRIGGSSWNDRFIADVVTGSGVDGPSTCPNARLSSDIVN